MWLPRPVYEALPYAGGRRRARVLAAASWSSTRRTACCSSLGGALVTVGLRAVDEAARLPRHAVGLRSARTRRIGRRVRSRRRSSRRPPRRRRHPSSESCSTVVRVARRSSSGSTGRSTRRVREFVHAELDHVARLQLVAAHALAVQEDAVGAVQVLDAAAVDGRDDLRVVAAHELAVDLQVVVGRAADRRSGPARAALRSIVAPLSVSTSRPTGGCSCGDGVVDAGRRQVACACAPAYSDPLQLARSPPAGRRRRPSSRSCAKAASSAVSHSVLIRRGMPPV